MKDYYSFIFKALLACLAYFADIRNMFHAVLVFMAIDWITGVYASYKFRTKGKSWFTSFKLRRSIEKFVFYVMAIAVAHILEVEFMDFANLDRIVAGYIAITEVKSIYENISKIMGVDLFNDLWQIVKNQFNQKFNIDNGSHGTSS